MLEKHFKNMPKWEIHDTWAEKIGISREISNFVNHLSDFPEESQEFMDFCEHEGGEILLQLVRIHDFRRIMKIPEYLQVVFSRQKGSEYVKAGYLHNLHLEIFDGFLDRISHPIIS